LEMMLLLTFSFNIGNLYFCIYKVVDALKKNNLTAFFSILNWVGCFQESWLG